MKKHETVPFDFEEALHKGITRVWLVLGLVCLGGAVFCGAWWHLFTAAICAVMYLAHKSEEDE